MFRHSDQIRHRYLNCQGIKNAGRTGFTLVELLVTMAAGLVLLGAVTPVIISEIRSGLTSERAQRAQEDFLRLTSLIDSEVSEASEIEYNVTTTGCSPSGSSVFTINVPHGFDSSTLTPYEATIHYFISSGSLYRCGPPFLASGALNPTGTVSTALLSPNIEITLGTAKNSKFLQYTLLVEDENGQALFSQQSGSRARAGLID
jgi:prepilin-type N-terminal cleavage/methylation domain-containing protein